MSYFVVISCEQELTSPGVQFNCLALSPLVESCLVITLGGNILGKKPHLKIRVLFTWRPVEHPGGVVLHLRLLEVEVLGLVVGDADLHALAVGLLGSRLVGGP